MATLAICTHTDFDLPLTVTDADGNPYNLTGKTVSFTIKKKQTDTEIVYTVDQDTHADAVNGSTTIPFRYADTSEFELGSFIWILNIWEAGPTPVATTHQPCTIYKNLKTSFS